MFYLICGECRVMKIDKVPSIAHLRRAAGPGNSGVFRIRGGEIDSYNTRDASERFGGNQ